jgi:antitoxin (DNA-binding transcriptional repressor) of toxin-antitoxin stability system
MKKIRLLLVIVTATLVPKSAPATTVIPPSFDELVQQAQLIFQGTVINVQSHWAGEGQQRRIVSDVTFRVEEPIKGAPGASYTLSMLGGTVDGESMGVADAPRFKQGDRDILFVENNGSQFIPLVGIMHGRFRLLRDKANGREFVTTNAGEPVADLSSLGKDDGFESSSMASSTHDALGAAEFKAAIRTKLQVVTP